MVTPSASRTSPSSRKARGAFFTPDPLARFLAGWAIRSPGERVLEPSCGEAASLFLRPGGRLALVLPAELLAVNYAAGIRRLLMEKFGPGPHPPLAARLAAPSRPGLHPAGPDRARPGRLRDMAVPALC